MITEFDKKKIEEIKKKLKPVDAKPLIRHMIANRDKMTEEEKALFSDILEKGFESSGRVALDRAFTEGIITEEMWLGWVKEYNVELSDIASVLQAYYNKIDEYIKDDVHVVTLPHSPSYKMKHIFKKLLNVSIITPEEAIKIMEKEKTKQRGGWR